MNGNVQEAHCDTRNVQELPDSISKASRVNNNQFIVQCISQSLQQFHNLHLLTARSNVKTDALAKFLNKHRDVQTKKRFHIFTKRKKLLVACKLSGQSGMLNLKRKLTIKQ